MKRTFISSCILLLSCVMWLAGGAPPASARDADGVPDDTEILLRRLPPNARIIVTVDVGEDNPSIANARAARSEDREDLPGRDALDAMNRDLREGFGRILRIFGLDMDLVERLPKALGPRFIAAATPGEKNGPPNVLFIASVQDRAEAERRIRQVIGGLARNAVETTDTVGDATVHHWSGFPFVKKLKLSYLVGDRMAVVGTDAAALRAVATSRGETLPAWIEPLLGTVPRGIVNCFVSPNVTDLFGPMKEIPKLTDLGIAGAASSLALDKDGITSTKVVLASKEGLASMIFGAGSAAPALTDDAFRHLPAGTLAAVAVSSPASWMKAIEGAMALAGMDGDAGGDKKSEAIPPFVKQIASLLDGDVAVGVRALLPLPSVLAVAASPNEDAARRKIATIQDLAKGMKLPVTTVTGSDGARIMALKIDKGPYENFVLQAQGSTLAASTDLRTLEESAGLTSDASGSLLENEAFKTVRSHLGEKPRILFYGDLSALSGIGMIASQAIFVGTPVGFELARAFRSVRGVGAGIEIERDRLISRSFISCRPGVAVPVMTGALVGAAVAAGLVMPQLAKARGKARQASCMSNMKQIAMAAAMYAQDHDQRLPSASAWRQQLMPYIKNEAVFHCPSEGAPGVSYAMNAALSQRPLAAVRDPVSTVLFYETKPDGPNPRGTGENLALRHDGGSFVAYVDGHVSLVHGSLAPSAFRSGIQAAPAPKVTRPAPKEARPARPRRPARP